MSEQEPSAPSAASQLVVRLIPTVGGALATFRAERYEERAQAFLEESLRGLSAERVISEIEASPEFADDFDRAVQAAIATSSKAKVRLLARVLRAELTAKDRAAIDNVQQILRVVIELDPVDIRALASLKRHPRRDPLDVIREELQATKATAHAVSSRLIRLGLVESETEAAVADPTDTDDDQVELETLWSTTPVFDAVMLMLDESEVPGS